MRHVKRAYGGNNIYQRYRRYLQKDILYSNSYTLAYRYARENGHFYEKLARTRTNADLDDTVSEPRERRPSRAKHFIGVAT